MILFTGAWLGAWAFGEFTVLRQLFDGDLSSTGSLVFLAFWLIAWTVGGAFILRAWLWNLAGREVGGSTVDFVNRFATKDGGWRWIDWSASVAPDEQLIYASARDITERKGIEAALAASERQTRQILETAHDAFIAIDDHGAIADWNPQAETTFGWSREEALGRELAETIIPEPQRAAHRRGMERFLESGDGPVLGRLLELSALHRDGHESPVELTISPLRTESGYRFNAFLRDITERKAAAELLDRQRRQRRCRPRTAAASTSSAWRPCSRSRLTRWPCPPRWPARSAGPESGAQSRGLPGRAGAAFASARRRRAAAPSEDRCSSRSLLWLTARPP